ncbi:hypothetical protein Cantr_06383 [Candida viswanathii]|uniref:T6SS Phospholipase effector Tle1-like catalytic domain-containing protein n=1 Tax=Candida viswanathii TaxID=5486 RepID=A0A367XZC0_9ASCO|nr:hypothetical protein Cantr_06383 [Candida viswanathii]
MSSSSYDEPVIGYNGVIYRAGEDINLTSASQTKNIVMCFDGTENEFGPQPFTNVLKIFRMLERDNLNQLCYYQPGIGSSYHADLDDSFEISFKSTTLSRISNRLDAFVAFTLEKHVMTAYSFLAKVFNTGDKVYLFGFSRGSFTARIIAGMIELVGLVNTGLEDMTPLAWNIYTSWEYAGQPVQVEHRTSTMAVEFKKTFSRANTRIFFMGLWDSVHSVGILWDRIFPYTIRTSNVDHVRHALSLDERRAKFKQQLFSPIESKTAAVDPSMSYIQIVMALSWADFLKYLIDTLTGRQKRPVSAIDDLVEVYFPGNHGDIGGGWKPTPQGLFLSDASFRWMLAQAINFGVRFQKGSVSQWSANFPSASSLLAYHHDVLTVLKKCPEKPPDKGLPEAPIKRFAGRAEGRVIYTVVWWLLEFIPLFSTAEDELGHWQRVLRPNWGRSRVISESSFIHWSVFYRLHYVWDYRPQNIPKKSFGDQFLQLFREFKQFKLLDLRKYAEGLTVAKIEKDWKSDFWKKIPDELEEIIKKNPNI